MLRVALTGGIGSGKSTVARQLASLGALVVDSDVLGREVVEPGTVGHAAVAERFGLGVLSADGALDRAALGRRVFADDVGRRNLERILHPLIAARTAELVAAASAEAVIVHDVPLLVEKAMGPAYHLVLVVGADTETRVRRLVGRGLTELDARARITAQAGDEARRGAADVWLDNHGAPDALERQVSALWDHRLAPYEANLQARRPAPAGPLQTVAADQGWAAAGQRLVARVRHLLGDRAATVEHVSPTSLRGALAPDLIELRVGVTGLEVADRPAFLDDLAAGGFPRIPGAPHETGPVRVHGTCDPGRPVRLSVRAVGSSP